MNPDSEENKQRLKRERPDDIPTHKPIPASNKSMDDHLSHCKNQRAYDKNRLCRGYYPPSKPCFVNTLI